jgi:hypothetical protein
LKSPVSFALSFIQTAGDQFPNNGSQGLFLIKRKLPKLLVHIIVELD